MSDDGLHAVVDKSVDYWADEPPASRFRWVWCDNQRCIHYHQPRRQFSQPAAGDRGLLILCAVYCECQDVQGFWAELRTIRPGIDFNIDTV